VHNDDLLRVEKPARYMGGEMGAIRKDNPELRFALAFPDVYEVGMSHLGLQILYGILNDVPWLAAERVYAPWPDREEQLRSKGVPLSTLEGGTPISEVDILGFTLQYELSYTNIINMLELGGIPLTAKERGVEWPLVIGGGPCAANPEPLAAFFDAFLLGDGEEAVVEIATACREWRSSGGSKEELLQRLSSIEGVYVPSFFEVEYEESGAIKEIKPHYPGRSVVRRRFLANLEEAKYPSTPVIPFLKTVHDRVSLEVARGCTRGCRFCQAGYIYRPVRERSPQQLLALAETTLRNTGYDEISLLSLSTGDYTCLTPLLKELMAKYAKKRVAVSFPSLRVGAISSELVEEVKKVRKTGFTLAPEAGSERLRQVINKGITEADLLENAAAAYQAGWRLIKLYFMIGLPTESMEDVIGIADLAKQVKIAGKKAGSPGEVNVAVSSFVPKAHTPFQWEPQISYEEILTKQQTLRNELKKRKLVFKWQDAPLSVLEGVFARGDRRLGPLLVEAHRRGCRFDGWREHFSFSRWQEAFKACGIDPLFYHRRRSLTEILPWDHLDYGVTREFLQRELAKAEAEAATPDCRTTRCTSCGICDGKRVRIRLHAPDADAIHESLHQEAASEHPAEESPQRIRLRFSKTGVMKYLSHLELINLFTRAVARSGIPIRFSQGFHPHPKFSFATALSVGIESWAEYMDLELERGCDPEQVRLALNRVLPKGVEILESIEIPLKCPSLSVIIKAVRYRVAIPERFNSCLGEMAERFLKLDSFPYRRAKQGKVQEFDLRHELVALHAEDDNLDILVSKGKPLEFVAAILGVTPAELAGCTVEKLEVVFHDQLVIE
jgi:radical SAM family uncharacterized protein/radical SAM-linked protein